MLTASLKQLLPSGGDKVLAGSTVPVAVLFKEGGSWRSLPWVPACRALEEVSERTWAKSCWVWRSAGLW